MSRELLLLRHGKSDWSVDVDDFHRPLKDRGKRGAQQIGTWLAKNDLQPDRVISSPAERAINTAEKAIKAMGASARDIVRDQRIYEAGVGALLRVLAEVPAEHRRVMLVGHNPGFENLLIHLEQTTSSGRSAGALRSLVGLFEERTAAAAAIRKVAVVAPGDNSFALARMYEAFSEKIPWEFQVFRDDTAARSWIDS